MTKRQLVTVYSVSDMAPTPIPLIDDDKTVIDLQVGPMGEPVDGVMPAYRAILPEGLYVGHEIILRRMMSLDPSGGGSNGDPCLDITLARSGKLEQGFVMNNAGHALVNLLVLLNPPLAVSPIPGRATGLRMGDAFSSSTDADPAYASLQWTGKDWMLVACSNTVFLMGGLGEVS